MQNKIVVRYQDGKMIKGYTSDFMTNKDVFHVTDGPSSTRTPVEVRVPELKAIFFVKDLVGNRGHAEKKLFDPSKPVTGRKIQVIFKDGERLVGTTQGYQPGRIGFFLVPADPGANNERVYVVLAATKETKFL